MWNYSNLRGVKGSPISDFKFYVIGFFLVVLAFYLFGELVILPEIFSRTIAHTEYLANFYAIMNYVEAGVSLLFVYLGGLCVVRFMYAFERMRIMNGQADPAVFNRGQKWVIKSNKL